MKISPRIKRELILTAWTVAFVAAAGGVIGFFVSYSIGGIPMVRGVIQGAFTGSIIAVAISFLTTFYPNSEHGQWLKRLSFTKSLILSSVTYLLVIMIGIRIGVSIFYDIPFAQFSWFALETIISIIISAILAIAINLGQQMNRMLGQGVMKNFLTGAYHNPREESRVFLFIDLTGSTGIAERLGPVEFHRLLDHFFYDLTDPVLSHKGEIHKYVGDEVIISWPLKDGKPPGNPVACFFDIEDQIHQHSATYERLFGFVPTFRGAINAGPVVTGEIGDIKREIVFLGDTVNTASRILSRASELEEGLLCPASVAEKLRLPDRVSDQALGKQTLRGRQQQVELVSLQKK